MNRRAVGTRRILAACRPDLAVDGRTIAPWAAALAVASAAACGELPLAMGDENSIVATVSPDLWADIEPVLVPALERTVFTVRDEKTFTVTHADPRDEDWGKLRLLRQQLVVGTAEDPWIADVLAKADDDASVPGVVQVRDVWARRQSVTALVIDGEAEATSFVASRAPQVSELLDSQYRAWAVSKMFVTGRNEELTQALQEQAGFGLVVPTVYEHAVPADSVHVFRNDNPDPSELIRQIAVTWRSPMPPPPVQGELLLDWRAQLVEAHYDFPQEVKLDRVSAVPTPQFYTVQAVWENPPDAFPAAGPFIMRAYVCHSQNRMYLLDAWLYAPGKEKYEYMIQLEEILDSFSCGDAEEGRSASSS